MSMSVAGFVVLAIIIVVAGYGVALYNSLVGLKHSVSKAWANVDVLLKQRHDELPKLVQTCKQCD
jgi:LemA protein